MTKYNYFRCDNCGKIIYNIECHKNQLMYTLIANYDTNYDKYKAHFCGKKCLVEYINKNVQDHNDFVTLNDGNRPTEPLTIGDVNEEKEKQ